MIEIKLPDLSRVALAPGDVLLVRCDRVIDRYDAHSIEQLLRNYFPGNEIAVLGPGLELAIVQPTDRERVEAVPSEQPVEPINIARIELPARGVAFPKVPPPLRPLLVRVLEALSEELREPGRRAGRSEVLLMNEIRRVFEETAA